MGLCIEKGKGRRASKRERERERESAARLLPQPALHFSQASSKQRNVSCINDGAFL